MRRDDFSEETKRTLSNRVNGLCSNPDCLHPTRGPHSDTTKAINTGVAAHITAASKGGPRFDETLSTEQRKHAHNGIWLCQYCANLIDADEKMYSVPLLKKWKQAAEASALINLSNVVKNADSTQSSLQFEEIDILIKSAVDGDIYIHTSDETGDWVSAGGFHFQSISDAAVAAIYIEAVESLANRGLVKYDGGSLYVLTGKGFRIARSLKEANIDFK